MNVEDIVFLSVLIFLVATLYASVGHGGASGYLAVMALFGLSPEVMKPVGLVLNILVSIIATIRYYRAHCFSWSVFLPITAAAIPFAFLGGVVSIPGHLYKIVAGVILLFATYPLFIHKEEMERPVKPMPLVWALLSGAGIGFLSGLTGIGGGIFLSPLLLFTGWSTSKDISGISAAFILANSVSALLGHVSSVQMLPNFIPYLGVAAILGGFLGSKIGSQKVNNVMIARLLAVVLVISGLKLIFV